MRRRSTTKKDTLRLALEEPLYAIEHDVNPARYLAEAIRAARRGEGSLRAASRIRSSALGERPDSPVAASLMIAAFSPVLNLQISRFFALSSA